MQRRASGVPTPLAAPPAATHSRSHAEVVLAGTTFLRAAAPASRARGPGAGPAPPVTHAARPMAAEGPRGAGPGAVRRGLWRQCARRVHGERLRRPSSGPRHLGAGTARMSASLVRATVRAVSKRKLQPTRAALTLTPSAVNKIKQLLKDKPEHVGVKVGVRTRGCNGLSYTLEYTKTKGDSDEEVVQDGVRVFIEKKAQLTLLGTEMDYVEDKLSSEFVFNNPNIKGTCGCGESFNI
ncbi:iron-sulfur cluster assembly 1 homolog, mitochondrial isoform X1 [Equus przewalskii]|uniref:Iron-sulfur cluster assembly 1 homolog, mitochondrial n=3 Tax=Equus TaxID=9789 RepID=A0A9L0RDD5_HORSE